MALFSDDAIVLRRLDYSETSQILLMFCRELGAQRLIAKGIKRGTRTRVAVGIDLLEFGTVVLSRRSAADAALGILTEWRQRDAFTHVRRNLVCLYAAQYAAEAVSHLTESADPHPALFDALHNLLRTLAPPGALASLVAFLLALLREIGLAPQFHACVSCGRDLPATAVIRAARDADDLDHGIYFSSHQGGLICRDCEPAATEKRRIAPAALLALQSGPADGAAAAPDAASAAFDVLDYHLTESIGRPLRLSAPLRAIALSK